VDAEVQREVDDAILANKASVNREHLEVDKDQHELLCILECSFVVNKSARLAITAHRERTDVLLESWAS